MVLQPVAASLAADITGDHFGTLPETVARALLSDGRLTLAELVRATSLPSSQVKEALLLLIQQNCVASWREPVAEGVQITSQQVYEVLPDRILQRLRFPRFLVLVRDTLGKDAELLFQGLLQNGRLRVAQILNIAAVKSNRPRESFHAAFRALVEARFVERAPSGCSARTLELMTPRRPPPTRGRGSMAAAPSHTVDAVAVDEAQYRIQEESNRFRLPPSVVDSDAPDASHLSKRHRTENGGGIAVVNDEADASMTWRANHEEFNRRFRHEMCIELVDGKVGSVAGEVVAVMLQLSRPHENRLQEERSPPLTESAIIASVARLITDGKARHITSADIVPSVLCELAEDTSELVTCIGEGHGGASYCVNMRRIIDVIRMREIDAVVRERFGDDGCRIFRLLLLKRQLEQKQVADNAMLPVKETRELLYRMFRAEYLELQEVAKTADHAPSRTFFLWRVDLMRVIDKIGSELHRTISRVRSRLRFELDREEQGLARLETARASAAEGSEGAGLPLLTKDDLSRLQRVRRVANALESSIMRLDQLRLLFCDL